MINQIEPSFDESEKKALIEYMDSDGWLTEHKKTEELEKRISEYTGSKYCVLVCNGTIALTTALLVHDISHEVLVPDYTMFASATSVELAGAVPKFVDIERETCCIDLNEIKKQYILDIQAIMLVSINGRYPSNVEEIIEFCHDRNILVIEDAAQSLGSFYKNKHIGRYGDIGCFSFSVPKIITTGSGGCLITDDKEVYEKIKMLKNFGRKKSGIDNHEIIGYNFKFTDIQAVIGIEQMKKLPWRVKRKKEIYKLFMDHLSCVDDIEWINTNLKETTPWMIDILIENRDKLSEYLRKKEIGTRPFHPAIHTQNPYYFKYGRKYPISSYISEHGLWLPSSTILTDENIEYICDTITKYYEKS